MVIDWLRQRRRRGVRGAPFPPDWQETLVRSNRHYAWLTEPEREKLRGFVAVWLAEKRFEGCRGMRITDEVRVAIAGQAGLVSLGFEEEYFDRLKSVLVYPGDYEAEKSVAIGGGGELVYREQRLGETWSGGSIVFSWPRVVQGGRMRDGPRNVVIHECAHALDMLDGEIDGVPPVGDRRARRAWADSMAECAGRFDDALDEGRPVPFDDYAAESPSEFFAVSSEAFFQDPHGVARFDGELYERLKEAWRQDPIRRVPH